MKVSTGDLKVDSKHLHMLSPKTGDLFPGRVLAIKGKQITLLVNGTRISASSDVSLSVGEMVNIKVREHKGGQIFLQIQRQPGSGNSISHNKMNKEPKTRWAIQFLTKSNLPTTPLAVASLICNKEIPMGKLLAELGIKGSHGLFLNTADRDQIIKQLQRLTQTLEDKAGFSAFLKELVAKSGQAKYRTILEKMVGYQLQQREQNLLLYLEIPLFLDGLSTCFLEIKEFTGSDVSSNDNEKTISIMLTLTTERLGPIKIVTYWQSDVITCILYAARKETRAKARNMVLDFEEGLKKQGLKLKWWQILPWPDAEKKSDFNTFGQVDYRI